MIDQLLMLKLGNEHTVIISCAVCIIILPFKIRHTQIDSFYEGYYYGNEIRSFSDAEKWDNATKIDRPVLWYEWIYYYWTTFLHIDNQKV